MRKLLIISLIGFVMVLGLSPSKLGETTAPEVTIIKVAPVRANPYQKLYEDLLRPSVKITAGISTGSGIIINHKDTKDTKNTIYVLTAAHVVGDYAAVTVTFYTPLPTPRLRQAGLTPLDRGDLKASVVLTDTAKDLALLRIANNELRTTAVRLAPKDYTPYIFTPVWVVGCSLGLDPRPSEGIITFLGCHSERSEESHYNRDSSSSTQNDSFRYWEISAPILPGNSGGGVFLQSNHQLIGIAVWVKVYRRQLITTMAGIVPINQIYEFLDSYKGQIDMVRDAHRTKSLSLQRR